jgi:hypothetical protein
MMDSKNVLSKTYGDSAELTDNVADIAHGVNMEEYRATVPLWKRVWQHSLTQMMLLSVQAFCGPAMSDAITGQSTLNFCGDS